MNLGGRRDAAWWKSAVVYQIYPRSFADSNGDGFGDLGGIIGRLDYLRALGVDVIWLSPIYRSPQADNGYDISDYRDIDPLFGTLAEFDALLAKVHELGMKLVMDLVVNHTSDEHPWFVESRSSRDNPKRDWYIWRDARDGAEPNNWGSFFGGSAWEWEQTTDQYYLHLFDRKQPDLNWENPQVRKAVQDIMVWWLDRGVDGFRMDVINFISKTEGLPDAPAIPGQRFVSAMDEFVDGPHVHDYLAEMTREVFDGRDGEFITVGEMPGGDARTSAALHRSGPGRAEHGLSVRARVRRPEPNEQVRLPRSRPGRPEEIARIGGRRRWRKSVGTACTGTTTTSLASCPGSATTTRITGPPRRRRSQPFCTACVAPRSSIKARNSE